MSLGNTLDAVYTITVHATGERVQLSKCSEENILEYDHTSDLKPSTQCRKAVGKAMQALGLIKRSFKFMNPFRFCTDFILDQLSSIACLPGLHIH